MEGNPDSIERGLRLREARDEAGLTQKKLAKKVGLKSYSTVSHHERGRNITWEWAQRYAAVLPVEADDLAEVVSPSLLARLSRIEQILARRESGEGAADSAQTMAQVDEALGRVRKAGEADRPQAETA